MAKPFGARFKNAWNTFFNRDPTDDFKDVTISYSYRPDRPRLTRGNERSIVTSIYNRIALDVSSINIQHCRLDENGRFISTINSELNNCLTLEANKDQTSRAFIQDVVLSMFDEGCVAIVRVYNDRTGQKEDIKLPKSTVAIIENPLYAVMNEPNSTMQRLIRKLNLLDAIDEQSGSGKLDLIIQLPYTIKSEARREQAEKRRKDIEMQLADSKYGIAYADATEHITQLNRSVENNLMKQIEYLTEMAFGQLGMTQTILDGTADEKTMLNYNNRIVEPIISTIVDSMKRKFLSRTARTQLQSITFFNDPFKLVPISQIAEIADKFTRNEILSSNEIRQIIGRKPSDDPKADELVNSNISQPNQVVEKYTKPNKNDEKGEINQNGEV